MSKESIEGVIAKQAYEELYAYDQLTQERNGERVFLGFKENKIEFAPTYKYEPFTTNYYMGEKVRTPAWCDRILWRGEHITQTEYKR